MHHGKQKSHLHQDAIATASTTVGDITYAASSVEQRNERPHLHHNTRAGTAARSFLKRNANSRPNSAHLAATITGPTLSELRELKFYTTISLPDIAHETHGAESAVEYAHAATNVRNCSAGENIAVIPKTFKQTMTLTAKAQ